MRILWMAAAAVALLLIASEQRVFRDHTDDYVARMVVHTLHEDEVANITCFVAPFTPTALIDWHFNGQQITQGRAVISNKYRIYRTDIDALSLFIYPAQTNDTGHYVCVENEQGDISEFDMYVSNKRNKCNSQHTTKDDGPTILIAILLIILICN